MNDTRLVPMTREQRGALIEMLHIAEHYEPKGTRVANTAWSVVDAWEDAHANFARAVGLAIETAVYDQPHTSADEVVEKVRAAVLAALGFDPQTKDTPT